MAKKKSRKSLAARKPTAQAIGRKSVRAAKPSKTPPSFTLNQASAVTTVIDLRSSEYSLYLGNLRLEGGKQQLEVGTMGGWTLQRLTHSQADSVRVIKEQLALVFDRRRTNIGLVDGAKRLVLPINWERLQIEVCSILVQTAQRSGQATVALFPKGTRIYFPPQVQRLPAETPLCLVSDGRGVNSTGPWAVVPPPVAPRPPNAA